jgi:hypothetical protein
MFEATEKLRAFGRTFDASGNLLRLSMSSVFVYFVYNLSFDLILDDLRPVARSGRGRVGVLRRIHRFPSHTG